MTGTGQASGHLRGEPGSRRGHAGCPGGRAAGARDAPPASVERVKCGFWKMRESSNLARELGGRLDQGAKVPPGGTGRAAPSVLRRARS